MNAALLGLVTQEKDDGSIEWPEITTATFVGITVAIAGVRANRAFAQPRFELLID
jgi:hypothetical protein